ncbi:hypothetical protein RA210_U210060 [Rubrivivax sp. A210]|nr:hypothetical protein RA210_U210060 [Rubrivivax sp. A210]
MEALHFVPARDHAPTGLSVGREDRLAARPARARRRQLHRWQAPFTGEVAWMRPEGRKLYFIGTVTALALEFSS